ncbi:MAG: MBL fold metallo-hydrolase [Clostridia bacterium]|nr:MBL fold metallo-hydrolase [Clostridia bacterium]
MKRLKRAICILLIVCSGLLIADRVHFSLIPEGAELAVHFIDVGQGDCSLIACDGHYMLIDGGPPEASSTVYSYLKKYNITHLDYIVCSHPHDDHCGGLSGALSYAAASAALCPVTDYDSRAFRSFQKKLAEQDVRITVPKVGDTFSLGRASFTVLGPVHTNGAATNDLSLVLRVVFGKTSFLFTGDAEQAEEADLRGGRAGLKSTVLKVAHHGSGDSTGKTFLRKVAPGYAVISVGKSNAYGHPTQETLSRLKAADCTVLRTDLHGDILIASDGRTVTYEVEKNRSINPFADALPSEQSTSEKNAAEEGTYIVNTRSKKFHLTNCHHAQTISDENRQTRKTDREALIEEGYTPCGSCNP